MQSPRTFHVRFLQHIRSDVAAFGSDAGCRVCTDAQQASRHPIIPAASPFQGKPVQVSGLSGNNKRCNAWTSARKLTRDLLPCCSLQRLQEKSTASQAQCSSVISAGEDSAEDSSTDTACCILGPCLQCCHVGCYRQADSCKRIARDCRGGAAISVPRTVQICCSCITQQGKVTSSTLAFCCHATSVQTRRTKTLTRWCGENRFSRRSALTLRQ